MNLDELREQLINLATLMEGHVDNVDSASTATQEEIYELLLRKIEEFSYINGRLDPTQPIAQRIARIVNEMDAIIGRSYTPTIQEYLGSYQTVEMRNISMQQGYNELVISKSLLTPARRAVYDQAEYFLVDSLADAYIQPAKYLLMQSVSNGISLKDAKSLLKNWNEGKLATGGRLVSDRPTPRLQTYSTQIARDSLYGYQGSIQEIIKKEYSLTKFIYQGGIVEDSRPFCKHLVSLRRKIDIDEVPPLVEKYPDGLKPNTTKKNFLINRGGYNCQHVVMMVRG